MFTNDTTAEDMERIRACVWGFLQNANDLPVACTIGSRAFRGIPQNFAPRIEKRFIDSNLIEYTLIGTDNETGIEVRAECLEYLDFPVVEWTLWMTNTSATNTPVISELFGMNGFLPGTNPVVIHNNGDTTSPDLYTDKCTALRDVTRFSQHPDGGRASDCALPYYRVLCDGFGYNLSIGWPGQWHSEFSLADRGFIFKAKQQYTHFYLKPGEKVRTPRITIMTFEGGKDRGINLWRRWMLKHVIPKPNGRIAKPCISLSDEADTVVFFTQTSEKRELDTLENFRVNDIVPDNLWIDAGWYPCKNPNGKNEWVYTGTLHADPDRFPNGLKPISNRCHELGVKLLVWFEPERVKLFAKSDEYPDKFVLTLKDPSVLDHVRLTGIDRSLIDDVGLMNLADKECCDWLIAHMDGLIKDYGIDIYRQDFNMPPLNWWLQGDGCEDRCGITENLYNQGYLRFWDELIVRNPGLLINSVSSGGRRSDLETLRRSVSLHQSDYGFGQHPVHQAIMEFSFVWEPFCGTMARSNDNLDGEYDYESAYQRPYEYQNFGNFAAHNAFCPSIYINLMGMRSLNMPDGKFKETDEWRYYKKFLSVWERAVPYTMNGDYYSLSGTDRTNTCYYAMQFHSEDANEGILQVIRNTKCVSETFTAHLHQINPRLIYLFESPEFDRSTTVSGQRLISEGFVVNIPKRSGEIWFYRASGCVADWQ